MVYEPDHGFNSTKSIYGLLIRIGVSVMPSSGSFSGPNSSVHQIIGNIFRKLLRLSGRARLERSAGQITTMISTDAARLDRIAGLHPLHMQLSSCLCFLPVQLHPSKCHAPVRIRALHRKDFTYIYTTEYI